jgi:methionyl-tRNA synthetase
MSLNEIRSFLQKCVSKREPRKDGSGRDICDICNKPFSEDGCTNPEHWNSHVETHYHKTQEEVMALMHLVLNLVERVEQLEHRLGVA